MTRWTKFIARFLIGLAVLVGLNWGLQAQAQFRIPGIPNIPVDIPAEIPGLDSLLSREPALTTSLEDAQQEIPYLDNYNPDLYKSLRLLPRTETNGFRTPPGDYAFHAHSYCLRAGTHGPGSGDGYLYAPLKGDAADIVQNVLRRSVDHPEIPQRQVQTLLWAIIAQTDLGSLPGDRQRVARTLLTDDEFARLSSGALGQIPDELLRRALRELPPVAQQVFEANARMRGTITRANSTFEELEQIAVLLGEAPRTEGSREVPAQRWSYHPDGYFVRYQPSGYSRTEMHVSVPQPFRLTRDAQGRITEVIDSDGNRILIGYDDSVAPLTVSGDSNVRGYAFNSIRMVHDEVLPPEEILSFDQTWNGQGWTLVGIPGSGNASGGGRYNNAGDRYRQAVAYQQQQAGPLERIGVAANSAAMKDLADVYHLQRALEAAIAPPANSWKADQLASLTHAWQYQLCRHAGACSASASLGNGTLVASAQGVYLAQTNQDLGPSIPAGGGTNVDPSGGAAVPGVTSKQRLGESSRPLSDDEIPPPKDPRCQQVARELAGLKRNQAVYQNPQVKELARLNDLDGYGYNKVVKETIAQQRDQGDDYSFSPENQRAAVEAALSESDDTGGSRLEVPAYTNASNCQMNNGDRDAFVANGRPGVIHDAYVDHEKVHQSTCNDQRDPDTNPDGYLDYMSDIDNYSQDEIDAYQAAIDRLQRWMDANC
ncbi:hypothetical protein C7271_10475 [filamentous cyanobacterium CCP5]|nr:hypothetical protein C7271_10475 [filamentous cyanobacterium CCP5]